MAHKLPGLMFKDNLWQIRLQRKVDGKKFEVSHSLGTKDERVAIKSYSASLAAAEVKLAAKISHKPPAEINAAVISARIALTAWSSKVISIPVNGIGDPVLDWKATADADRYEQVFHKPDTYRSIPNFDEQLCSIMNENGYEISPSHWSLPYIRQEASLTVAYALRYIERIRLSKALQRQSLSVLRADLDEIAALPEHNVKPKPSLTISELHEKWMLRLKPSVKERGRLNHQTKRLIEWCGDIPCNHVGKTDIRDFMGLVSRFPGRKRPAELARLPMVKLVERFEDLNADLVSREKEPMRTLSITTVGEWFSSYKRMFTFGVELEYFSENPFNINRKFVVSGIPAIVRREFKDAEIAHIFSQPLFHKEGRGVWYWLPILSLFHGCRLSEFTDMSIDDFKQSETGQWYFEIEPNEDRKLKNENARRRVPLHPKLAEIGFLEHVAGLKSRGEKWLFPDLDHLSSHGSGHEYSKRWGEWMGAIGLTDPTITHHSWRHTWKQTARSSDIKEEIHDVLSGHAPVNIGRNYGRGAPIDVLAVEMAKIAFPSFPDLRTSR